MKIVFIEYPKCSTCQKAKKSLKQLGATIEARHIVDNTPSKEELKVWWDMSGLELKKWFNTSGNVYKDMHLKEKLPNMNIDEQLQLLSEHGMLIKRPIVIANNEVILGYQEDKYAKLLSK